MSAFVVGSGEDFFHTDAGDDTFQGAKTLTSGPRRKNVGLLADVDQRSLLISYRVVANPMLIGGFLFCYPVERYWV
jgi:hypothetical protein